MSRTKIVCTIGPASQSKTMIEKLIKAGMDCTRLNFSHGTYREHAEIIKNIRLSDMIKGRAYLVAGIQQNDSAYAEKLYKMGFVEGTPVRLAPVELYDPMVIEIRGSRIALRRQEAKQVYVWER